MRHLYNYTITVFHVKDRQQFHISLALSRVAKFESKVGRRRTTKIGNLVVLDIFLVALILRPYKMRFV